MAIGHDEDIESTHGGEQRGEGAVRQQFGGTHVTVGTDVAGIASLVQDSTGGRVPVGSTPRSRQGQKMTPDAWLKKMRDLGHMTSDEELRRFGLAIQKVSWESDEIDFDYREEDDEIEEEEEDEDLAYDEDDGNVEGGDAGGVAEEESGDAPTGEAGAADTGEDAGQNAEPIPEQPERPILYWLIKSSSCDHGTREKIVLEMEKMIKNKKLRALERMEPIYEDFSYKKPSPFVHQYEYEDGTIEEPRVFPERKTRPRQGSNDDDCSNIGEVADPLEDIQHTDTEAQELSEAAAFAAWSDPHRKRRKRLPKNWIIVDGEDDATRNFFEAAKKGAEPIVRKWKMFLAKRDYYIHEGDLTLYRDDRGRSALHFTAMSGNEQAVDALKELVNTQDEDGWTPLHTASYFGNRICCDKIVKYGADVDIICYEGKKSIDYARIMKWKSTAQTLIRFGLDEDPKPWGGKKKKQLEAAEQKEREGDSGDSGNESLTEDEDGQTAPRESQTGSVSELIGIIGDQVEESDRQPSVTVSENVTVPPAPSASSVPGPGAGILPQAASTVPVEKGAKGGNGKFGAGVGGEWGGKWGGGQWGGKGTHGGYYGCYNAGSSSYAKGGKQVANINARMTPSGMGPHWSQGFQRNSPLPNSAMVNLNTPGPTGHDWMATPHLESPGMGDDWRGEEQNAIFGCSTADVRPNPQSATVASAMPMPSAQPSVSANGGGVPSDLIARTAEADVNRFLGEVLGGNDSDTFLDEEFGMHPSPEELSLVLPKAPTGTNAAQIGAGRAAGFYPPMPSASSEVPSSGGVFYPTSSPSTTQLSAALQGSLHQTGGESGEGGPSASL